MLNRLPESQEQAAKREEISHRLYPALPQPVVYRLQNPDQHQNSHPKSSPPPSPTLPNPQEVPSAEESTSNYVDGDGEPAYYFHRLGEAYTGPRAAMKYIGLDIGTKNIVIAYRDGHKKVHFLSEINGYYLFERGTPFIENMLNDPTRKRADGTSRPARWFKMPETNAICVIGADAEEFAYAKNDTMLRPMAEGGVTPDTESMTVLASLVKGLLETADTDLGEFDDDLTICYCTTAPALNKDINIPYHQKVVELVISHHKSLTKISTLSLKESHAVVLQESQDGTGIGISWGAGTTTVSYIKYGIEIYSFSWVGAGDWIDEQVALRHGYVPHSRKPAKETPTTVCRRKHQIDLTPGHEPTDRVGVDILLHYEILIQQVLDGVIDGFMDNANKARIAEAVNVYVAGGSASPAGFEKRVANLLTARNNLPFTVGKVIKSKQPLYAVAEGCLKAAELSTAK